MCVNTANMLLPRSVKKRNGPYQLSEAYILIYLIELNFYQRWIDRIAAATANILPRTITANARGQTSEAAAAAARLLGPWWSRRMYNTWITQSCPRATFSRSLRLLRSYNIVVKYYYYFYCTRRTALLLLLLLLYRRRRRLFSSCCRRRCWAAAEVDLVLHGVRGFIAFAIVKCFLLCCGVLYIAILYWVLLPPTEDRCGGGLGCLTRKQKHG